MSGDLPRGTCKSCCPPIGKSGTLPIVVPKMLCSLVQAQLSRPFAAFETSRDRVVDGDRFHLSLAVSALVETRRQCQRLSTLLAHDPVRASGFAETLEAICLSCQQAWVYACWNATMKR